MKPAVKPIQVVGMAPIWGLPSPSPFCLKLETWLRMEQIPYAAHALEKLPQSKTGKVPYIVQADDGILADSNIIIESLARERGINLTYGATPQQAARAQAILRMIEESLYFAGVWERWFDPRFYPITVAGYFGRLPAPMRAIFAALVRRKIRAALHGQGIARHAPERIVAIAAADVQALAALLGDAPYFHGARAGVADASAYGLIANLLAFPADTPLKRMVAAHPNLVAFEKRMRAAYWRASESPDTAPGELPCAIAAA